MKTILTYSVPFTLNAGTASTSTLDFSAVPNYNQKFLYAVTNNTTKQTVYATGQTGLTGTSASNILTLNLACAGMTNTDSFTVIYDLSGIVTAANSVSIAPASDSTFIVQGGAAVGSTPVANPVAISGVDGGGLKRHIKTDATGIVQTNSAALTDGTQKSQIVDGSNNVIGSISSAGVNNLAVALGATNYVASTANSTVAQLGSGATFTGTIENTFNQQSYSVLLVSNQPGSLVLNQYIDAAGTQLAQSSTFPITAGVGFARSNVVNGNFFRVSFTNSGGGATTTLRIDTAYGTIPASTLLNNAPIALSEVNGSAISLGQTTAVNSLPVVLASNQTSIPVTSAGIPTSLGQQAASASQPVTLSNENVQDLYTTGASAQTATVNNILPAASGAAATDVTGYRSGSIQLVSTGTAGTFQLECSNDNVNFQLVPMYNQTLLTAAPSSTITASATQLLYVFPITGRYIRLRIATTITGGSIQAFSKFTQVPFMPGNLSVGQSTAANLNMTAVIASGTVTTVSTVTAVTTVAAVTAANLNLPGIIADVASAALTVTTTTATLTPTFGTSYSVVIPVTAVSGTTPTLDVQIQESDDTGTNWTPIYDFARITATGIYRSPVLPMTGNRVRYLQTVTGTTPSFTRAVNRLQSSLTSYTPFRQQVDRSIVLTTLNSTTPSLTTAGASRAQLVINIGAATTPPVLQVEGSDDNGLTWYAVGSTLTGVASSTVQVTVTGMTSQLIRARVSTIGVTVTAGYVLLKAF